MGLGSVLADRRPADDRVVARHEETGAELVFVSSVSYITTGDDSGRDYFICLRRFDMLRI
jgi:hypothetical protein